MKAPVYTVIPKNIFKHPFNKYDLDKPTTRQTQNEDLSDYFNYGFNEDTMNIYGKLVKRTIQTLDQSINSTYFDDPSKLMRLNDEIPMDFGGFCKFFDTSVFDTPEDNQQGLQDMEEFHNGQELFSYFIYQVLMRKPEYPLIDFVKSLYRPEVEGEQEPDEQQAGNFDVVDQIEINLERKYKEIMRRLQEKKNNAVPPIQQKNNESDRNRSDKVKKEENAQRESFGTSRQSSSQSQSEKSSEDRRRSKKRKQDSRDKSKRRDKKITKETKESSRRNKKKRSRERSEKKKRSRNDRSRERSRRKDKRKDKDRERDRKKRRH